MHEDFNLMDDLGVIQADYERAAVARFNEIMTPRPIPLVKLRDEREHALLIRGINFGYHATMEYLTHEPRRTS